jgi:hypothetical protein
MATKLLQSIDASEGTPPLEVARFNSVKNRPQHNQQKWSNRFIFEELKAPSLQKFISTALIAFPSI